MPSRHHIESGCTNPGDDPMRFPWPRKPRDKVVATVIATAATVALFIAANSGREKFNQPPPTPTESSTRR